MKKIIVAILAGASMLAVSAPATALSIQDREWRQDYRADHRDRRNDRRDYRQHQRDYRYDHHRYQPRGYYGSRPYYHDYEGYRQGQVYRHYRDDRYVVRDYRRYDLPAPRQGYRYYRDDNGNVVMAAIAGGVIGLILGGAMN